MRSSLTLIGFGFGSFVLAAGSLDGLALLMQYSIVMTISGRRSIKKAAK